MKDRSQRLKSELEIEESSFGRVESCVKRLQVARRHVDNQLCQINANLDEALHLYGVSETEQIWALKASFLKEFFSMNFFTNLRNFTHIA